MTEKKNNLKADPKAGKVWFAAAPEPKPWNRTQRVIQVALSILAVVIIISVFQYNIKQPISWEEILPPVASPPVMDELTMSNAAGRQEKPYADTGKTLLYFWKEDCCEDDLRQLLNAHKQLDGLSLSIIATQKDVKAARAYLKNIQQQNVKLFFQPKAASLLQPETYPTVWLMDNKGRLLAVQQEKVDWHFPNVVGALQQLAP